jgi:putative oxidoreductase
MTAFPIPGFIARCAAAAADPVRSRLLRMRGVKAIAARLHAIETTWHRWLVAYSVMILRVSLGAVFLAFGALKFFPGVSPAQGLVERTTDILLLGLVPGSVALVLVAMLECVIGLCLVSGRAMRGAIYLLVVQLIGILSPLVLLPGRLFAGPHGAPTLEGQYVIKDLVLVGATLVLAATLRGGRLTTRHAQEEAA